MNPLRLLILTFALSVHLLVCAAEPSSTLSGNVSNVATGNLLEGARVEIPALNRSALTDKAGRYLFAALPPGTHTLVASYTGLDKLDATVTVAAGATVIHNFDLTADIYKLAAFKVTGEREGFAAAITAERNADNVKNVVATDQFGNLPNLNAGEVAMRLPGVYGNLDAGGNSFGFTVRGMDTSLNSVTMDGGLMTSQGGANRSGVVNNITSTMFEQVEVTKGHRPDEGADALGGTINFKSRSPLTLREKRRVTYSLMARLTPSFTQQIPLLREHPAHQIVNLGWQEVFNAFGGERNLGVALNLYHSEFAFGWYNTTRDFQNTTAQPAFLWDYRTSDTYNHRRQNSVNLKTDYRLSPHTKLSALVMASDQSVVFRRNYDTRAFVGTQDTVPNATSGIVPGYTDRITQVRPTTGSNLDITSTGPNFTFNRTRRFDLGAEQTFGPLALDYVARRTSTHFTTGQGEDGGSLVNRLSNIGWILDRTKSDLYPSFTQTNVTPTNDITNPANYRPNGFFTNNTTKANQDVTELRFNARYTLPVSVPSSIKAGASWRDNGIADKNGNRRWTYLGTGPLPSYPSIRTLNAEKTGLVLPMWQSSQFIHDRQPVDATLWREDKYFFEANKFTGTDELSEKITACYVMGQARFGATGLLAGVRTERTETNGSGFVRARVPSTAAQQTADPVGSAQRDYAGNFRESHGRYTKSFPSIHLTRDLTANLRAKLSWSTSFGRPGLGNYGPTATPNENNPTTGTPTLTVNNPSLLPQTATNW
ncbi:MAG: TonB-dependent receptor, partial [Opitutaceae bacterium]